MIHGYSKIYNLGHKAVRPLTESGVDLRVEEKVDGSQFSFGRLLVDGKYEVCCRSKNAKVHLGQSGMFEKATAHVERIAPQLPGGWVFRCEYLQKPKHNALAYDRVPTNHLMLFDIEIAPYNLANRDTLTMWAKLLEIDVVPLLKVGTVTLNELQGLMAQPGYLGGTMNMEGVVLKPDGGDLFDVDKKVLMGKYVSEAFREAHDKNWKKTNPQRKDILEQIVENLRTERAWEKGVERMRDRGELTGSYKDIGPLIKDIQNDVIDENADAIKDALFNWARREIARKVCFGVAEWYKQRLLAAQFEEAPK